MMPSAVAPASTRLPSHLTCHSCPRCGFTVRPECDRLGRVCVCQDRWRLRVTEGKTP